ncbi:MAG: hypothetical protein AAF944_01580 [Bacteroidota bacterium]
MKAILTLLLSSLTCLTIAQDVRIFDYVKTGSQDDLFIIGGNEEGVFTGIGENYYYNGLDNKPLISYYSLTDGLQESRVLKPEDRSKEYFYTFYFQGQLHTLLVEDEPNEELLYPIYLETYGTDLNQVGEARQVSGLYPQIFTANVGNLFRSYFSTQFSKMRRNFFFSHAESVDGNKAMLLFNYGFFNDVTSDVQCLVFDENMEEAWSGFIDLPDANGNYQMVESYALANDGTLYMLVASFGDDGFKKTAGDFEYFMYKYHPDQGEVETIDIPTNNRFIINLGMQLNDQQQPVFAGIYANPANNDLEGGILIQGDKVTEHPFPAKDAKEINEKDDKKYAEEYTIKHLVREQDGSVVFFAESYKRGPVIKPKLSLGGLSPLDADLELGDIYKKILAVKMHPQGESWLRIIDKDQKSTEERDVYTSFALAYHNDTYHLIFNNAIKKSSDVSLVKITSSGDINLETMLDRKSYRLRLVPTFAKTVHDGHLVVPVERQGKQALTYIQY